MTSISVICALPSIALLLFVSHAGAESFKWIDEGIERSERAMNAARSSNAKLIGANNSTAPTLFGSVTNWLDTYAYGGIGAGTPVVGLSRNGGPGLWGASRTSDSSGGASIGIGGFGFCDAGAVAGTSASANKNCWAGYDEVRVYQGNTATGHAREINITNLRTTLTAVSPYSIPTLATIALHLGSGGGCSATGTKCYNPASGAVASLTATTASVALNIVPNVAQFEKGLNFSCGAILGADCTDVGGQGTAMALGRGQVLNWFNLGGTSSFVFGSVATSRGAMAAKLLWSDTGLLLQNGDGSANLIQFYGPTTTAVNGLHFAFANTGVAPGIAAMGSDANIDLNLAGKGAGKVSTASLLKAAGFSSRAGTSGEYANHHFNIYWDGTQPVLWIDTLSIGRIHTTAKNIIPFTGIKVRPAVGGGTCNDVYNNGVLTTASTC